MDFPKGSVKPHECTRCRKTFNYAKTLEKHMLSCKGSLEISVQMKVQEATLKDDGDYTEGPKIEDVHIYDSRASVTEVAYSKLTSTVVANDLSTVIDNTKQISEEFIKNTLSSTAINFKDVADEQCTAQECFEVDVTSDEKEILPSIPALRKQCKVVQNKHRCGLCKATFSEPTLLEDHHKTHLNLTSLLDDQRNIHCVDKQLYKCKSCKATFRFLSDLTQHLDINHTRHYQCDKDELKISKDIAYGEPNTHSNEKNGSKPCDVRELRDGYVAESSKEREFAPVIAPTPYKCRICLNNYATHDGLLLHMNVHIDRFKCERCDKTFNSNATLRCHVQRHLGIKPHKCTVCKKTSASKSDLRKHMLIHTERGYKCDVCERTFIKQASLDDHKNVHLDIKPHLCAFCSEKYSTLTGLRRHQNKYHISQIASQDQTTTPNKCSKKVERKLKSSALPPYVCSICSKTYDSRSSLHSHINTHTSRFECEQCSKTFDNASNLEVHIRRHLGIQPNHSTVCNGTRASTGDLKKQREHKCNICGHAFTKMALLEEHRKVHPNKKPFKCTFCMEAFSTFNGLKSHRNICNGSGQQTRSSTQNLSNKTAFEGQTSKPSNVNRKTSKHTNEFQMLDNNVEVNAVESKSAPSAHASRLGLPQLPNHNEDLFMCGYCDERFPIPSHLQKHTRAHHWIEEKIKPPNNHHFDHETKEFGRTAKPTDLRNLDNIVEMEAQDSELKDAICPDYKQEFELIIDVIDEAMEKNSRYSAKKKAVVTDDSRITTNPIGQKHLLKVETDEEFGNVNVVKTEKTELSQEERLSPPILNEFEEVGIRKHCGTTRKILQTDSFVEAKNIQLIKEEPNSPTVGAESEAEHSDDMEFLSEDEVCPTSALGKYG